MPTGCLTARYENFVLAGLTRVRVKQISDDPIWGKPFVIVTNDIGELN
jgi:hypothetical protein